jgi:hypothetical protein
VGEVPLEQGVDDALRLRRRHDPILGALLDEHRRGDLLGVGDGARDLRGGCCWTRAIR